MANNINFTKQLGAASATSIAASQACTAGTTMTLTASPVIIDTAATANTATGRRVLLTSASGSETMEVTITGTNQAGYTISETITFSGSSTTLVSNLDYVTVSSLLPVTSSVGNVEAGTNGVGASPWVTWNWQNSAPMNVGFAVELVSGSVNYTVQYSYDDPNNLPPGVTTPLAFTSALGAQTATADGTLTTPFIASRVLINSGTGALRCRFVQAGIG
jgi:hypothetical protein